MRVKRNKFTAKKYKLNEKRLLGSIYITSEKVWYLVKCVVVVFTCQDLFVFALNFQ